MILRAFQTFLNNFINNVQTGREIRGRANDRRHREGGVALFNVHRKTSGVMSVERVAVYVRGSVETAENVTFLGSFFFSVTYYGYLTLGDGGYFYLFIGLLEVCPKIVCGEFVREY
jgi:hypothetical protein